MILGRIDLVIARSVSDEAIQSLARLLDCFALLAMTKADFIRLSNLTGKGERWNCRRRCAVPSIVP